MNNLTKFNELYNNIIELIDNSKKHIVSTINSTIVYTYFKIGKMIIEEEQKGNLRAKYGEMLIDNLSERLTNNFGKGFSKTNLKQMRQFYLIYSNQNTYKRVWKGV